jgi:hypothetical protein
MPDQQCDLRPGIVDDEPRAFPGRRNYLRGTRLGSFLQIYRIFPRHLHEMDPGHRISVLVMSCEGFGCLHAVYQNSG